MICIESHSTNLKSNQEHNEVHKEEGSDCENEKHSNDDEDINTEIFVRLTDMVRKHYCGYLQKQLLENVWTWRGNKSNVEETSDTCLEPREKAALQECCRVLEDKALKACMHARRYQRSMLKIISEVRRSTQELRLNDELKKLILIYEDSKITNEKSTQTEESMMCINDSTNKPTTEIYIATKKNPCSFSLEQKIEMFQERLNQEAATKVTARHNELFKRSARHSSNNPFTDKPHHHYQRKHIRSNCDKPNKISRCIEAYGKDDGPASFPSTEPNAIIQDTIMENANHIECPPMIVEIVEEANSRQVLNNAVEPNSVHEIDLLEQDDEIAKELAQLFSEEKSELEELLGLNPNSEIDDPQVRYICEEIANAPLSHETKQSAQHIDCSPEKLQRQTSPNIHNGLSQASTSPSENMNDHSSSQHHHLSSGHSVRPVASLRHSLWPCELYMQRRRLTTSLSRLIEEDFRWHDLIKWKFNTLFGEDSDDEFSTCSPSIELDEILICSCIRRISPWMVKHLMKPMRDGLIANRFLFKKLAKRLAHSIILENQYPDERFIKQAVEEYFCLHQAVVSLEDMANMPNLKTINEIG